MLTDGVDDISLDVRRTESRRCYAVHELQDVALLLGRVEKRDVRFDSLRIEIELVLQHHIELVIQEHRRINLLADSVGGLIRHAMHREECH